MADLADAIAAAEKAAEADPAPNPSHQSAGQDTFGAPPSPSVKPEPNIEDIPMAGVEEQIPASPLKRSRSPFEHQDTEFPTDKRLKTEPVARDDSTGGAGVEAEDMDEFARLVQQAQDSVMQDDYIQLEGDPMSSATGDFLDSAAVSIIDLEEALLSMPPTRTESIWNGTHHFTRRKHVLPALGSLAVDVLVAWSEQSLEDTIRTLCHNRDSDVAREYVCLKTAFDAQRRCLSEDSLLLDPYSLGVYDGDREIVRVANLAASCASLFSTLDIGLEEVNDQFLMIFIPQGHDLSQDAADIFLALKTQIFLAMLDGQQERTRDEILEEVFPTTLRSVLEAHHIGWPLNNIETQFLADAEERKTMLRNESNDADSIQSLSKQFSYETFLETLNSYLNDNIESIKMQGAGIIDLRPGFEHEGPSDGAGHELDFDFDLDAAIAEASRAAETDSDPNVDASRKDEDLTAFLTESISKAAEQANGPERDGAPTGEVASAAESASKATMMALQRMSHGHDDPQAPNQGPQSSAQQNSSAQGAYQQRQPQPYYPYPQHNHHPHPAYRAPGDHLPPNQSDSTPALYERARQAAAARSSTQARREGTHSTRRPWSPEEEKALMMGLDMVKGPHWSQILGLFGPNGSISQILADRTQVQLKDKARNLKLFFLKANTEMPYYLQCVTGELKTRAPTQAARKEAEEKAKEEQQAHVNGVHPHAGGGHVHTPHNPQTPTRPSTAMAPSHSTTPVQRFTHPHLQAGAHHSIRPPVSMSSGAPRPPFLAAQPVHLPVKMLQSPQQPRPTAASSSVPAPPATARSTPQATPDVSEAAFSGTSVDGTPQEDLSIEDAALLDLQALLDGDIPDDLAGDVHGELAAALNGDAATDTTSGNPTQEAQTIINTEKPESAVKEEPSQMSAPEGHPAPLASEPLQSGFLEKEEDDFLLDLQAAIDKEAKEADAANGEHHAPITESVESETDLFDIQAAIEREAAQAAAAEETSHSRADDPLMDFQMTMERDPPANVTPYRATSSTTA
ncbi:telomere repeat binding factor-domain-containing protein [Microdochium trichocladiopsis]|uniref:Telomere repeat binding factor-domain-containing protein n=1 Tax=Microdochium trichocladiopsis TaxID=1682393 RepID=A0A9P9BVT9_9PEZI|nr:telomere repeat binding factor-domain-containing protein [Microdochium trichocladiopsis]KAH7039915.1 telomere repeat binding factor-domain-containing protein [Microdochium trichocladiopsis]